MVDDRLIEVGRPSSRFMRKYGLNWFSEGENEDYFAPELLSVTEAQVEHFRAQAASLYELALRAARHVSERQLWAAAGIPDNAVELVEYSIHKENGLHLAGRFDFAGGLGRAPLKLLEFNADTFSLAPETATVMPHQLELLPRQHRKNARQYNNLLPGLAQSFRRILSQQTAVTGRRQGCNQPGPRHLCRRNIVFMQKARQLAIRIKHVGMLVVAIQIAVAQAVQQIQRRLWSQHPR